MLVNNNTNRASATAGSAARNVLVLVLVMAMAAVGAWFGRKAYKAATEKRLVAQAAQFVVKKDFANASLCLQKAHQMNPFNAVVCEATADMLDTAGSPAALNWRMHAAQLDTNNVAYRLAWAQTALRLQELASAGYALSGIDGAATNTAAFHKLCGVFAWERHNPAEAERQYQAALQLEPTNQTNTFNLATVRLASTNEAVSEEARLTLEAIHKDSPLRGNALRSLISEAAAHTNFTRALGFFPELLDSPSANFNDRVNQLGLLHASKSADEAKALNSLQDTAKSSPDHAFLLGRWMAGVEGPAKALEWMQTLPAATQTNQPVPLIISDCQVALKDWSGLLASLERQDWGKAKSYRFALQSLAMRGLKQDTAAQTAWSKALRESAHRLDALARLAQVTTAWGWQTERIETLRQICSEFPKERWALNQLVETLYLTGNTAGLKDLLSKACDFNTNDMVLKNSLANVCLLRKVDLEKAHRLANEVYNASTNNPFFTTTYAYSLLMQNRKSEATNVLSGIKSDYLQNLSIAAYYGTVQAMSGNKELAKPALERAQSAKLLPEEKEMVRVAMAAL